MSHLGNTQYGAGGNNPQAQGIIKADTGGNVNLGGQQNGGGTVYQVSGGGSVNSGHHGHVGGKVKSGTRGQCGGKVKSGTQGYDEEVVEVEVEVEVVRETVTIVGKHASAHEGKTVHPHSGRGASVHN
ncbi:hypothetical protein AAC387_Pa07g0187 [Persea americana]